ncbi:MULTISPECIES: PHP domain-containing protein [Clostridium]|uniref:PHP domain-containing protein n=1 Tax=Clostridium TaxID=1485 RepID=UPI0008266E48|nr:MULTISPECIES: PHP domain-containing protein [Clostridium]
MESTVDLHLHTTCSDGDDTPLELILKLSKLGIKLISITDHDSVKAYSMLKSDKRYHMKIINGVELTFVHDNYIRHMLAYNFNISKMEDELNKLYTREKLIDHENGMLMDFFKCSKKTGLIVDNDLKIETGNRGEAFNKVYDSLVNTPLNLEICPSLVSHTKFFWHECMNKDSKFFIDASKGIPTLKEVLKIIKDCEGLAVLAHPFQYPIKDNSYKVNKEVIDLAIKYGIDGIEAYHKSASKEQSEEIISIANNHDLFVTGGSDYHGNKQIYDTGINEKHIEKFLRHVNIKGRNKL